MTGRVLLPCFGFALATACASARPSGTYEVRVNDYVFGAFGGRAVDARDVCGLRPAHSVEIRRTAMDYVVSVSTLGMYVPHRVRVRCEATP